MDDRIRNGSSGFLCQKADAGDMMWENAVNNAGTVTTGGSTKSIARASAGLGAARLTQPRRRLGWTAPVWSRRGSGRAKCVPFGAAEPSAGLNGSHL